MEYNYSFPDKTIFKKFHASLLLMRQTVVEEKDSFQDLHTFFPHLV